MKHNGLHNELMKIKKNHPRGIYLLPNLLTTAALFSGFYSIVAAMKGLFDVAAIAVFVAMVADALDGRVARITGTQTAFGAEYDSLSDLVSFGVAPALIVYSWSLSHLGKIGWLAAFLYAAATALRLSRFNTQPQDYDKRYFQGLPCPAAAGVIAGCVWLGSDYDVQGMMIAIPVALMTVMIAGLMVSTIRYYSFKQLDMKGRVPFIVILIPIVIIVAIALNPPPMLFAIFLLYAFCGPVLTSIQVRKMKKSRRRFLSLKK